MVASVIVIRLRIDFATTAMQAASMSGLYVLTAQPAAYAKRANGPTGPVVVQFHPGNNWAAGLYTR